MKGTAMSTHAQPIMLIKGVARDMGIKISDKTAKRLADRQDSLDALPEQEACERIEMYLRLTYRDPVGEQASHRADRSRERARRRAA